jgi:hypothetical protein
MEPRHVLKICPDEQLPGKTTLPYFKCIVPL